MYSHFGDTTPGWTEADLGARRKRDRAKLKLAVKLRAETTITLKWIAARLQMGTEASLSNLLSAQSREGKNSVNMDDPFLD